MAAEKEIILLLKVTAGGGKESSTYLGFDFISQSPSLLLPNVQQLGWDLLPGAEEIQASYLDCEGDRCTLTERTAPDALSFAVVQQDENTRVLEVQVHDKADAVKSGCVECSTCLNLRSRLSKAKQEAAEALTAKTAAEQELAASCQALQAEVDAATRRADALEKGSGPRDLTVELKTKSDEVARLMATNDSLRAELAASRREARPKTGSVEVMSALVSEFSPLMLGIEATEDPSRRGNASNDFKHELERLGAQQVHRLGCMQLAPASGESGKQSDSVPASAKFTVLNNGGVRWPDSAVLVIVKGDNFGVPLIPLGPKPPGEGQEITMDLLVPFKAENSSACSIWAIVNAATGTPLGPLLVLEVEWKTSSEAQS